MGLLDSILGGAAGSLLGGGATGSQNPLGALVASLSGDSQAGGSGLLAAAMALLQQNGGLANVVAQFERAGLGSQVQSWVGTGANLPVSGEQLTQALGSGSVSQLAAQLGLDQGQVGTVLAQLLPEVVNQVTPQGQVTAESHDLLAQALSMLGSRS